MSARGFRIFGERTRQEDVSGETPTRPCRGWWGYRWRRLVCWLASVDNTVCRVERCPESTVGYSVWCREHTDQILEHRHSRELDEALGPAHLETKPR